MTAIRNNLLRDLPGDLQLLIVDYLSISDLLKLGRISKYFYQRFHELDPLGVWKHRYQQDISAYIVIKLLQTVENSSNGLSDQLLSSNDQLLSSNDQLLSSNNQLLSSNDQLLSSNNQLLLTNTQQDQMMDSMIYLEEDGTERNWVLRFPPVIKISEIPSQYYVNYRLEYRHVMIALQNTPFSNSQQTEAERTLSIHNNKIMSMVTNGYEKLLIKAAQSGLDPFLLNWLLCKTVLNPYRMDLFELVLNLKGDNSQSQNFAGIIDVAINFGNILAIDRLFELGSVEFLDPMAGRNFFRDQVATAVRHGRLNVMNHLMTLYRKTNVTQIGLDNLNFFLSTAAEGGYLHIMDRWIALGRLSAGANDFNRALIATAIWSRLNVVNRLIENGANDFNGVLRIAAQVDKINCYQQHLEFIDRIIKLGANNFNEAMIGAITSCKGAVVERLVAAGANNFDEGLEAAAIVDSLPLIDYMKQLGATNWNGALLAAVDDFSKDTTLKHLIKCGANDINGGLIRAVNHDELRLVKFFVTVGATAATIQQAYEISLGNPGSEVTPYLKSLLS